MDFDSFKTRITKAVEKYNSEMHKTNGDVFIKQYTPIFHQSNYAFTASFKCSWIYSDGSVAETFNSKRLIITESIFPDVFTSRRNLTESKSYKIASKAVEFVLK